MDTNLQSTSRNIISSEKVKKQYFLIIASLLFCLSIYLFYRTTETVVTSILVSLISFDTYESIRGVIVAFFPLNYFVIYSLPEGLWVFSLTLAAKGLYLSVKTRQIDLTYLPLIFSTGLEFLQLTPFNKGEFQLLDLLACALGWFVAKYVFKPTSETQSIIKPFNYRSTLFLFLFSIVYLAHVWG
ncbi:MAG: hypothetical protein ACI81T_002077 [Bacteroidia bacterium]